MASSRQDDDAVVLAFRAGDQAALADLYARWSPLIHGLVLSSLGDLPQAEEVTQRVFTRAWASRTTFDPSRTRFSAWLVDLARDGIDHVRGMSDRPAGTSAGSGTKESVENESKSGVLAERFLVADSMSHLETSKRRVLQMALDHLTLGEIAGRTGLRVDEVRLQVAAGLTELRQQREAQADAH